MFYFIGLLFVCAQIAGATVVAQYHSREPFFAAADSGGKMHSADFENTVIGDYSTASGVTDVSGVSVLGKIASMSTFTHSLSVIDDCITPANVCLVGHHVTVSSNRTSMYRFRSPLDTSGFEFGHEGPTTHYSVILPTNNFADHISPRNTSGRGFGFFGFRTHESITYMHIYSGSDPNLLLDNVVFFTDTPEPASLGVSALALGAALLYRQRINRPKNA